MRLEWTIDDEDTQKAIVNLYRYDEGLPRDFRAMRIFLESLENHGNRLARSHVCDETPALELNKAQERGYAKAFFDIVEAVNSVINQHVK